MSDDDDEREIWTARDLLDGLLELAKTRADFDTLKVYVRVQDDDANTMVGGLFAGAIDPGCTEIDALVLDGSQDIEGDELPDDEDHTATPKETADAQA